MSESLMQARSEITKVEDEKISTIGLDRQKSTIVVIDKGKSKFQSELLIMFLRSNHH